MKIIIAANTKKADILCDRLKNAKFLYLKEVCATINYEKTIVFPCFIYNGYEYDNAVKKIKRIYPNAHILPPLISREEDYFKLKYMPDIADNNIFCIHKCSAVDIEDDRLWKIGDTPENIVQYLKKRNFKTAELKLLFMDTHYHLKNDIPHLITELKKHGIESKITLHSVLESEDVLDYIVKIIKREADIYGN